MDREVRVHGEAQVYLLKHSRDSGKVNPFFRLFSFFLKIKPPLPRPLACLNVCEAVEKSGDQRREIQRARTRYTAAAH